MHPRTLLMLAAGFLVGLTAAACGTASTCTTANCGGCCSTSDKCEPGGTAEACGMGGNSCGRCGSGTVCMAGECRGTATGGGGGTTGGGTGGATGGGGGSTGGGGGTTGGGGGTTGGGGGTTGGGGGATGGGGGCRVIGTLETSQNNLQLAGYRAFSSIAGHFNLATWVYPVSGANPDGFRFEVGYPGDVFPTLPLTQSFTAIPYRSCDVCAMFYENCATGAAVCGKEYLAQSGSFTVTRADRGAAGRLQGTATSVRFNEWNFTADQASGTGCVIVNTVGPFDVGWNADGGAFPP